MEFDEPSRDRESQPRSFLQVGSPHLLELLEDPFVVGRRDADAVVADTDLRLA